MKKKKVAGSQVSEQEKAEKPIPAFLRDDYPYKAIDEALGDLNSLGSTMIYEIKCYECEMAIRSLGTNIKKTYARLKDSGCIGCGNKNLIVKRVDMSAADSEKLEG